MPMWIPNASAGQPVGALEAVLHLYCSPAGSDTNDGSIGAPFLTLQKALAAAARNNTELFGVEIHLADGTYAGDWYLWGWMFPKAQYPAIRITGNEASPQNVVLTGYGYISSATFVITGIRFAWEFIVTQASSGEMIKCHFASAVFCFNAASVYLTDCLTFQTPNQAAFWAEQNGFIAINSHAFTNGIAFNTACAVAKQGGIIDTYAVLTGSPTGPRYQASTGGGIRAFGNGANAFAGTVAGTADAATCGYYEN